MRRLNKRGMDDKLMFVIWEVIVVVMVVVVLTISVRGIANNTTYWKKYHSADLSLMTDLLIANQGDFTINYDMKDLQKNFVMKAMRIDPIKFQTFMKDGSFFIYDKSIDEDRFPQSFIFARDRDVIVLPSNTSSGYIVLQKEDKKVGMKDSYIIGTISCPSEDTKGDLTSKHFDVISLSDETLTYGKEINIRLMTVGQGQDNEALIALAYTTKSPITIYYDSSTQISSKKMACLIQRQLLLKFPDMNILSKQYDNSQDIEPFTSQRDNYNYWIFIEVDTSRITDTDLRDSITNAITEYYG